ncbi:unnamed protein product [Schistosoma rodhaini]|uniref:Uncharacterized protein n=1 Tax=Schistosoma rodhaini TaxID=6188 RepID=A0AA85FD85_9TREM|nr:unnamed protein product [Schistosoma rodhaini]
MNINSLLATTFFILSLHASNAAHMNTNLTAPLTIGITTFYANKQPVIKSINQINQSTGPVLFNFTDSQNKRGEWYEISETVRVEERSDATLVQHVCKFHSHRMKTENIFRIINHQSSSIHSKENEIDLVPLVSNT